MKALPVEPSNVPVAIGSRIRAARQSQRLTIEQVADATGLTKGFLSRVERDLTSPSVASLVTLCQVLSISIGDLFAAPETHLTKQNEGPRISLGGEGIVERLLTARSERRVQIIQAVIEPRGRGESELYAVDCDVDVLHVVKGSIRLILTNEEYELSTGDTVTFPGREPPHLGQSHGRRRRGAVGAGAGREPLRQVEVAAATTAQSVAHHEVNVRAIRRCTRTANRSRQFQLGGSMNRKNALPCPWHSPPRSRLPWALAPAPRRASVPARQEAALPAPQLPPRRSRIQPAGSTLLRRFGDPRTHSSAASGTPAPATPNGPAPWPAYETFTFPDGHLSFSYPSDWSIRTVGSPENVSEQQRRAERSSPTPPATNWLPSSAAPAPATLPARWPAPCWTPLRCRAEGRGRRTAGLRLRV